MIVPIRKTRSLVLRRLNLLNIWSLRSKRVSKSESRHLRGARRARSPTNHAIKAMSAPTPLFMPVDCLETTRNRLTPSTWPQDAGARPRLRRFKRTDPLRFDSSLPGGSTAPPAPHPSPRRGCAQLPRSIRTMRLVIANSSPGRDTNHAEREPPESRTGGCHLGPASIDGRAT